MKRPRTSHPWIAEAIHKKGALHQALHIPADEDIPVGLLKKVAHAAGKLGRRARLAITLRKLRKKP